MIEVATGVRIEQPIKEVFDYVSDPRNFPRWNSAVRSVPQTSVTGDGARATYTMQRNLPTEQRRETSSRSHSATGQPNA